MDALHLDARLAATSHWGKTHPHHRSMSPSRSPDQLATVRMAASASPPPSTRSLSSEHGKWPKVDDTGRRTQDAKEATRSHLDARTWMPSRSREPQEHTASERITLKKVDSTDVTSLSASMLAALHTDLSIQRKMHEKLTSEFVASQKDLRLKAAEWIPPNRFHRCVEELVEPLWKAHNEVLSQCSSHREQHEELWAQATRFSSEHQAHSAALRDLNETSCQMRASLALPMIAAQRWSHSAEPWRKELEALRSEQRSALADQVHLLQKEFEAAYRAEQVADMAMNRVAKLEKGLSDIYDGRSIEDIGRRINSLETEKSEMGTRSIGLSTNLHGDSERTAHVNRNVDDLAAVVSCQADKLCQLEREFLATREALSHSQNLSGGLEEERSACQMGLVDLKSELQHSLVGIDTMEQRCMEAIAHRCDVWAHELTSQREDLKRLGKSCDVLARQVEGLHHKMCECCSEVAQRCGGEAEARVSAIEELRGELTNAMTVIKAQFDEWMEMVRVLKGDVADLTKVAKLDQDYRSREVAEKQSEFTSLVEIARSTLEDASRLVPWSEPPGHELQDGGHRLHMDALAASFDRKQYCGRGAADANTVCRLVIDILACIGKLSKSCVSECNKCRTEVREISDLSETSRREHQDGVRNLQKDVVDLRLQLKKTSAREFDGTELTSTIRKELDMALAAFHTRQEGRAMEIADSLSNLSKRVHNIERSFPSQAGEEWGGNKTRVRQSILNAVETIEAAAQRVAGEASLKSAATLDKGA